MFSSWFNYVFGKTTKPSRRQGRAARPANRPALRPRLEALEDRMLLSVAATPSVLPVSNASATQMGNGISDITYPYGDLNASVANSEAVSANGQYVVFTTTATDLIGGVTVNNIPFSNVYLRNLIAGTTSLVDVTSKGTVASWGAENPVVTPNGRYVAFLSASDDLPNNSSDGGNLNEVFVRDMQQGQTYMVSQNSDGNPANGSSEFETAGPAIAETANGQLVIAYFSEATNLTPGDTDNGYNNQVFVATLKLDANGNIEANTLSTKFVSGDSSGNGGNGDSTNLALSRDGSTLAFLSAASNLPNESADPSGHHQLFSYNVAAGTLAQINPAAVAGGSDDAGSFSISDNGQYIAYVNQSADAGGNESGQILVWNAQMGSNNTIASGSLGLNGTWQTLWNPAISGDGSTVAFLGSINAGYLMPDVYVTNNWQAGAATLRKITDANDDPNVSTYADLAMLSDNGQILAYDWYSGAGGWSDLYVTNLSTGASTDVGRLTDPEQDPLTPPAISADGSTVIFNSYAPNVVSGVGVPIDSGGNPYENVYYDAVGANHYGFSAPATVTVGTSFQVTLTAEDVNGNAVANYNGTVQLRMAVSGDPPSAATATFVNGVATVTVTPTQAGQLTIRATDAGNPDLTSISSAITVTNTPTSITKVSAAPRSIDNNTNNSVMVQATIASPNGTVNEGSVIFTLAGPNNTPRIASNPVAVSSNGTASIALTLPSGATAGSYSLTVSYTDSNGIFAATSSTIHNALTVRAQEVSSPPPPPASPPASILPPPMLSVPPLLTLFDNLLGGIETLNASGTEAVTDSFFGIPLLVSTFDSNGDLISVDLFGFLNITFLFG